MTNMLTPSPSIPYVGQYAGADYGLFCESAHLLLELMFPAEFLTPQTLQPKTSLCTFITLLKHVPLRDDRATSLNPPSTAKDLGGLRRSPGAWTSMISWNSCSAGV
jgi:hypothetical protein